MYVFDYYFLLPVDRRHLLGGTPAPSHGARGKQISFDHKIFWHDERYALVADSVIVRLVLGCSNGHYCTYSAFHDLPRFQCVDVSVVRCTDLSKY